METTTPSLALEKFRRYSDHNDRPFYLSKGVVTENGQPKVSISRWSIDAAYRELERAAKAPEGSIRPQTLYESHTAAKADPDLNKSIFSFPAEWQLHLILNPNAPTETDQYVLRDADGKPLQSSRTPRVLNPVRRSKDGERQIVEANVFDLPFELKDGRYGPEMLDPESGFLKEAPKAKGPYSIWFGSENRLYASVLLWHGDAHCGWGPSGSDDDVWFRGASTGNIPVELLEPEVERRTF